MKTLYASITIALALLLLSSAACGDDDGGPQPSNGQLPTELTEVEPAHGASVTNDDLQGDPMVSLVGICGGFAFQSGDGMGNDPTSLVTMTLNGQDVTADMMWITTDDLPPSLGTGCYSPAEPLGIGEQHVVISYTDVDGDEFDYSWSFTITE